LTKPGRHKPYGHKGSPEERAGMTLGPTQGKKIKGGDQENSLDSFKRPSNHQEALTIGKKETSNDHRPAEDRETQKIAGNTRGKTKKSIRRKIKRHGG